MAYRNKTYVCFDGDKDIHYYRLMQAWHQSDHTPFDFYNSHDLNSARDTSQEASIKAQLRVRLQNTKIFVVLIGEQTRYLYKFVRWEMDQALAMGLPIVAVNLNGLRQQDTDRCPPIIRDELALHISFRAAVLQEALEIWPENDLQRRRLGKTGPHYFEPAVYTRLGIAS
jgi:hypothetical protein